MSSQFVYVHDCAAVNVTTSAYLEIIDSSTDSCTQVQCMYHNPSSPDNHFTLAVGDVGEEVDVMIASSTDPIPIRLVAEMGTRFSVKAVSSDLTAGLVIISLLP